MQLKALALAACAAATASAFPATQAENAREKAFRVASVLSGSPDQYTAWNAAKSSLFAGLPYQNASCTRPNEHYATFYIRDSRLYLYDQSGTLQELFVDRSGMGQGKIGYTTGAQHAPKNSERAGWSINYYNHLQFAGRDFIACPNSIDGAWSIWATVGFRNPGGSRDCIGIAASVVETNNPNSCKYTG